MEKIIKFPRKAIENRGQWPFLTAKLPYAACLTLNINPLLVSKIGLKEAIIVDRVHYLTSFFGEFSNDDGYVWIRLSYEDLTSEMGNMWPQKTTENTVRKMVQDMILVSANMNRNAHDRTLWYRVNYTNLMRICGEDKNATESI